MSHKDTYEVPWELLGTGACRMDAKMGVLEPWYRLRMQRSLSLIAQKRTQHFRVLDLGCGVGLYDFAIAWKWPNSRILGVDINPIQIEFATSKAHELGLSNRLKFECADVTNWHPNNEYWDVVLLTDIIEHLENPSFCLRTVRRAVRKGSQVILSVPATSYPKDDWWFYRQVGNGGDFSIASTPEALDLSKTIFKYWHKEYSIKELHELLHQEGFIIVRTVLCRFPLKTIMRSSPAMIRSLLHVFSEDEYTLKPLFDKIACDLAPQWAKTCIVLADKADD